MRRWRWIGALPLLWALDFNVDPMSSVVAQMVRGQGDGAGRDCDCGTRRHEQACEEFLKRYAEHEAGVEVYGDASGYQSRRRGRRTTG